MKYDLVGVDGNAWAVMGYVGRALKNEGLGNLVDEYQKKAMSGDYDNLLRVSLEYLDKANEAAAENGYEDEENLYFDEEDSEIEL